LITEYILSQSTTQEVGDDFSVHGLDTMVGGMSGLNVAILSKDLKEPKGWMLTLDNKNKFLQQAIITKDNLPLPKDFFSLSTGRKSLYAVTKVALGMNPISQIDMGFDYFVHYCNFDNNYVL
jgi:hypothetical protein